MVHGITVFCVVEKKKRKKTPKNKSICIWFVSRKKTTKWNKKKQHGKLANEKLQNHGKHAVCCLSRSYWDTLIELIDSFNRIYLQIDSINWENKK